MLTMPFAALALVAAIAVLVCLLARRDKPRRTDRRVRLQLEWLTERIAPAALHHWTDATGDKLASTVGNWDGGPVAAGDSLSFDGVSGPGSNDDVTFNANFTTAVASITIAGTYTGAVNFNANLNIPATLTDLSAQAQVNIGAGVTVALYQCTFNGSTVNGPGTLQIVNAQGNPGAISLTNGATLSGLQLWTDTLSQVNVQGNVTLNTASAALINGPTVWSDGKITLQNNSKITNNGYWTTVCDKTITGTPGCAFLNARSFTKNTTAGQTNVWVDFSNAPVQGIVSSPTVTVNNGTINFTNDGNQAGQFVTNTGSTLLFGGGIDEFTANSLFSGFGSVRFHGGTWNVDNGITATVNGPSFELGGLAVMGGPGSYNISSNFTWDDTATMSNSTVVVYGTFAITGNPASLDLIKAHLIIYAQTTWDAAQDITMTASTLDNYGVFQIKNAQTVIDGGNQGDTPSTFSNHGTLTKLAGGASAFGVVVSSNGTLDFNGLAMSFFARTGALTQFGAGSVTDLGGGTMTLGTVAAPLTFNLSAGELTGTAGATINGNLVNGGLVDFGSAFGTLSVIGGYTQTSAATLRININGSGDHDFLSIFGQASLAGHLVINGSPWPVSLDIFHAGGGVSNSFSDCNQGWTPQYIGNDVWVQGQFP